MTGPDLPRELVLASAGSGKTFRISSRIIGLLEAGEAPERILASTFARKAAGEILNRVLERLADAATDEAAARELARHALLRNVGRHAGGPAGGGTSSGSGSGSGAKPGSGSGAAPGAGSGAGAAHAPEDWLALLRSLVGRLHRTSVGTLDSFFVRAAGSFATELGLPPTWRIADEPTARRLETEALQDVLASADPGEMVELVRALMRGDARRAVQERLLEQAGELRGILHELDPEADEPWAPFHRATGRGDADAEHRGGRDAGGRDAGGHGAGGRDAGRGDAGSGDARRSDPGGAPTQGERAEVARAIDALEPPTNKDGSPHKPWSDALASAADAVRSGDWDALVGKGIGAKLLAGEDAYYRKPIPPEAEEAFRRALDLARRERASEYDRQARALGRLARDFDEALARRQRSEGAYRFGDVTRLLGGPEAVTERPDLWYRLDRRARHLLLDEFQDTSVAQWLALAPLAEELLSGHRDERAAVIVADPKQSIYGWRGAEPELVQRIGRVFALETERMHASWRSSEPVLDLVNDVFRDLPSLPVWEKKEGDRAIVEEWASFFEPHAPAGPRDDDPSVGHVRVEAGPRDEKMRAKGRPRMMRRAAELVVRIRRRAPGATVGVLTRHNEAVARLIAELRARGVEASEEGGTHLTDSPAVTATLALLRLADHPAHRIARYHVARTPLGGVVGFADPDDDVAARRVSGEVRADLLRDGYGATLDRWTRALGRLETLDRRGLRRMLQLVETGFRWDPHATLRPGDFVRYVESERVEDPLAAPVRVMTVHRAKGLEFDVVVLPELDTPLTGVGGGGSAVLPERDPRTSRIRRVFPYVSGDDRPLLPEIGEAWRQHRAAELRDALGVLYVGLTRARRALHVLVAADDPGRGPGSTSSFARVVREALAAREGALAGGLTDDHALTEGDLLYEAGDPRWFEELETTEPPPPASDPAPLEVRLAGRRRTRALSHRSPSELEGGGEVDLGRLLDLHPAGEAARRRGTVVHEWCRRVGWLDRHGLPDEDELREVARAADPELDDEALEALLADFRTWLAHDGVRRALSLEAEEGEGGAVRDDVPGGASDDEVPAGSLDLRREVPFAVRLDDEIIRGVVDRLVLERDAGGTVRAARIIDFKTDRVDTDGTDGVHADDAAREGASGASAAEAGPAPETGPAADRDPLEAQVAHYRPQLRAYRRGVQRMYGLEPDAVRADLVFLRAGVVREGVVRGMAGEGA